MNFPPTTATSTTRRPASVFDGVVDAGEMAAQLNNRDNYETQRARSIAQAVAIELRNRNLLSSLEPGKIAVGSTRRIAHIWNLALQSPVFDRLWLGGFKEYEAIGKIGGELRFPEMDEEMLAWIVEYLESSDEKREEMEKSFPPENLLNLLLAADYLQVSNLIEKTEQAIISKISFERSALEVLSSLELGSFKTLQQFLFLIDWFQVKNADATLAQCCFEAKKLICSRLKHPPHLTIGFNDLVLLRSVTAREAPQIDFSLQPAWQPDETSLMELDGIARVFRSRKLLLHVFGERLKLLGARLDVVSAKKLYVDGVHKDNYHPYRMPAPEPVTERYLSQKRFFHQPYPSPSYEAVVYLSSINDAVIQLIREYPSIKLGLKVSDEALLEREESIPCLANVHLLACEDDLTYDPALVDRMRKIMRKMPNLDILVVKSPSLGIFAGSGFSFLTSPDRKITLWKSLSGKVIKNRVAIHNAFDAEWTKEEDSYTQPLKRKMASTSQEELTAEDIRIRDLIGRIPFAKNDLPSATSAQRMRFSVGSTS